MESCHAGTFRYSLQQLRTAGNNSGKVVDFIQGAHRHAVTDCLFVLRMNIQFITAIYGTCHIGTRQITAEFALTFSQMRPFGFVVE